MTRSTNFETWDILRGHRQHITHTEFTIDQKASKRDGLELFKEVIYIIVACMLLTAPCKCLLTLVSPYLK